MSGKKSRRKQPDRDELRKMLRPIYWAIKASGIAGVMKKLIQSNDPIKPESISDYVNKGTKPTDDHFGQLRDAWYESFVTRGLRFIDLKTPPVFEAICQDLVLDSVDHEDSEQYIGNYFMYYGSYVKKLHYSVRALKIERDLDGMLKVTDKIRDLRRHKGKILSSAGFLVFHDDIPQILLIPMKDNESKIGFTIMLCRQPSTGERELEAIKGTFSTVTKLEENHSVRGWLMLREEKDYDRMVAESGAYPYAELLKPEMAQHLAGFRQLKEQFPETSYDPMLDFEKAPKELREKKKRKR